MKLIEKRKYFVAMGDNAGVAQWVARAQDALGVITEIGPFDHDPSHDEIVALLPAAPSRLRPSTLAQRVEDVAELARQWNALNDAAARAATDPDFTATERTRLNNARDLAKAALKAYI